MIKLPLNMTSAIQVHKNNVKFDGGFFPIGENNFWHGGIRLKDDNGDEPIYPIAEGKIIAYRLSEDYEYLPLPNQIKHDEKVKLDKGELKKHPYTKQVILGGKNYYQMKGRVDDEMEKMLQKEMGLYFSNNFVLIEHELKTPNECRDGNGKGIIKFYTLYMHLKPDSAYNYPEEFVKIDRYEESLDSDLLYRKPFYREWNFKLDVARDTKGVKVFNSLDDKSKKAVLPFGKNIWIKDEVHGGYVEFGYRDDDNVWNNAVIKKNNIEKIDYKGNVHYYKTTEEIPVYHLKKPDLQVGTLKKGIDWIKMGEQVSYKGKLTNKVKIKTYFENITDRRAVKGFIPVKFLKYHYTNKRYGIHFYKVKQDYILREYTKTTEVIKYKLDTEYKYYDRMDNCTKKIIFRKEASLSSADLFKEGKSNELKIYKYIYLDGETKADEVVEVSEEDLTSKDEYIDWFDKEKIYAGDIVKVIKPPKDIGNVTDQFYVETHLFFNVQELLVDKSKLTWRRGEQWQIKQDANEDITVLEDKGLRFFSSPKETAIVNRVVPKGQEFKLFDELGYFKQGKGFKLIDTQEKVNNVNYIDLGSKDDILTSNSILSDFKVDGNINIIKDGYKVSPDIILGYAGDFLHQRNMYHLELFFAEDKLDFIDNPAGDSITRYTFPEGTRGFYTMEQVKPTQQYLPSRTKMKIITPKDQQDSPPFVNAREVELEEVRVFIKEDKIKVDKKKKDFELLVKEIDSVYFYITEEKKLVKITDKSELKLEFTQNNGFNCFSYKFKGEKPKGWILIDKVGFTELEDDIIELVTPIEPPKDIEKDGLSGWFEENPEAIKFNPEDFQLSDEVKVLSRELVKKHGVDGKIYLGVKAGSYGTKWFLEDKLEEMVASENLFEWKNYFEKMEETEDLEPGKCDLKDLVRKIEYAGGKDAVVDGTLSYGEVRNAVQKDSIAEMLNRLIVKHPTEWHPAIYEEVEEVLRRKIKPAYIRNNVKTTVDKLCWWNGISGIKDFPDTSGCTNLFFAHPARFVEHIAEMKMGNFNPYGGKRITSSFSGRMEDVFDNPGFAVYTGKGPYKGYTSNTGIFNDGYRVDWNHEGVDFTTNQVNGLDVHCLIYGTVVVTGWNLYYGPFVIVQAADDPQKFFLAGHLSSIAVEVDQVVVPKMLIGKSGEEGAYSLGPHLHVSVFVIDDEEVGKIAKRTKGDNFDVFNYKLYCRNPFNHKIPYKAAK